VVQNTRRNEGCDPSPNVLRLVEDTVKRQDDLRKSEIQRLDERITSNFESVKQINEDGIKRIEGLLKAHFDFSKQTADAESRRIDENREIDNKAVSVAAGKAEVQANVLANNVALLAETLRKSVEATATTIALQLQQTSTQLIDRIALLEKSQYENKGSAQGSILTTGKLVGIITAISTIIGVIFLVGPKIFG
jgi:RNA binding exosome subunit